MRITVHHKKHYEWVPVPVDVTVTQGDLDAGRVKTDVRGGRVMRVTLAKDHTTDFQISEGQIIAMIVAEKADPKRSGRTLGRKEAVAQYLSEFLLPHFTDRRYIAKVEIHDDGHDLEAFNTVLAIHAAAQGADGELPPNIHPDDVDDHVAKYTEAADHVAHLHAHFRVKK